MNNTEKYVQERLFALKDEGYRDFHARLIPNIEKDRIIGVRTPELRKFAKELSKSEQKDDFLKILPHIYYEENNLHAFLIETIKDYDECIAALDRFLPFVDNWATCDTMSPKVLGKNKDRLISDIKRWISSDKTYTIRFGTGMLMKHFLDDDFSDEYPEMVSEIISDEYYINMMIAWYFATALSKQYTSIIPYLENKRLSDWVHNKTIRKAIESYRVTKEQKAYLRTLTIK